MVASFPVLFPFPLFAADTRPQPYLGQERNTAHGLAWGQVFLSNLNRVKRLPTGDMGLRYSPFIHKPGELPADVFPLGGIGADYLVRPNKFPIYQRQVLFSPHEEREVLAITDVRLILELVRHGLSRVLLPPALSDFRPARGYSIYMNPMAGSGRSIFHLHLNAIPEEDLPLLGVEPAPWPVAQTPDGTVSISRAVGIVFYALLVQGDDEAVAKCLVRLDMQFRLMGLAYNLLTFANRESPDLVRVLVVPRSQELSTVADQRVAGLEFLSGALVPGPARGAGLSFRGRDQALQEVTLDAHQALRLDRFLRSFVGMPTSGLAVLGVPDQA